MSEWNYSAVLLIPITDQADGNAISELLGYGPETFVAHLAAGPDGGEPTHLYNHTYAAQSFVDMVAALGEGTAPEGFPAELMPALSRMIISIRDGGDPVQHITDVLTTHNLVII